MEITKNRKEAWLLFGSFPQKGEVFAYVGRIKNLQGPKDPLASNELPDASCEDLKNPSTLILQENIATWSWGKIATGPKGSKYLIS